MRVFSSKQNNYIRLIPLVVKALLLKAKRVSLKDWILEKLSDFKEFLFTYLDLLHLYLEKAWIFKKSQSLLEIKWEFLQNLAT